MRWASLCIRRETKAQSCERICPRPLTGSVDNQVFRNKSPSSSHVSKWQLTWRITLERVGKKRVLACIQTVPAPSQETYLFKEIFFQPFTWTILSPAFPGVQGVHPFLLPGIPSRWDEGLHRVGEPHPVNWSVSSSPLKKRLNILPPGAGQETAGIKWALDGMMGNG